MVEYILWGYSGICLRYLPGVPGYLPGVPGYILDRNQSMEVYTLEVPGYLHEYDKKITSFGS